MQHYVFFRVILYWFFICLFGNRNSFREADFLSVAGLSGSFNRLTKNRVVINRPNDRPITRLKKTD